MNQQLCDPNRLSSFVRGELTDEAERELTAHLDECESCGKALEHQVAEESAWRDASALLGDRTIPEYQTDLSVSGLRNAQIDQVLSQLLPTDDPESLGRIGGYEVTGVIGSGGMGVVLKAREYALDRVVAVKVMAPHLAASGSARRRFAREAKAAAAVLHPNVIAIHGVSNEQALPYLVMPYVRGESLQKRIDAEGPLPLVDILRIGAQVAAGLAAAHEQGLVHRDIKPGNVLLEQGVERVTITDFGLARAVDDASMTRSGVIAGTPQYMSPEQARGEPIDARSDLFSLGSLLYAMCTGHSPFRAETSFGVLHRITHDEPRPITEINPDIPLWLEGTVMRVLARNADDRFQSAGEVAELLEGCLTHTQNPATTPLPETVIQLSAKPSRYRLWLKFVASGLLMWLFAFAGVLIVLEWNKGTLRIESELDEVPIRIFQEGKVVDELVVSRDGTTTRIAAGKYTVEIDDAFDKAVIDADEILLSRGDTKILRVIRVSTNTTEKERSLDMAAKEWLNRPLPGYTIQGEQFELRGYDALLRSVMTGDADALRRLLVMNPQFGSPLPNPGEWTLLQHALHQGNEEIVDILLEHGVDPFAASEGTPSPAELAERTMNSKLIEKLRQATGTTSSGQPNTEADKPHKKTPRSKRTDTVDDLMQITLALHRYHEVHGHFPAATIAGKDGQGGSPHSWRVEILSYLGHPKLYDDYHFDEPWDSEHNQSLFAKMPDAYRSPLDSADSTNTSYFGVVSDDVSKRAAELQEMREQRSGVLEPEYEQYTPEATVFWKQRGASFRDMHDGTSHCIAVIEAQRDIPWTKPADIEYSADQPLPKFGGWFEQGVHAAMADGTVKFLASDNDEQTIRNLLTITDGQPVEPLLVRRLRIHGAVAVSEAAPEMSASPETYQVPDGPLLRILPDQQSIITEADILEVAATTDPNNAVGVPIEKGSKILRNVANKLVTITLTEEAGKRFLDATTKLSEQGTGGYMVIMFDRKVVSAPRVHGPISSKLTMTGKFDAKALAEQIQAAMNEVDADNNSSSKNADDMPREESPIDAAISYDAPFKGGVRWGDGIYENAFVKKGDFIAELLEFDPDLLERTKSQLSAAKHQVDATQAVVQANENNLMAEEATVEAFERQRKAYEEVQSQIETAAAATVASAKNRIEARKADLAEHNAVLEQTQREFTRQQKLFEEALISKQKFQAAEQELKVAGARAKRAEAELQTAENDLIAQQSDDQAKKEKSQVDIDLAAASLNKAQGEAARAEGELANARLELKKAQKQLVELESKLARQRKLLIHAPFSGFVTQLENGIVNKGDRIFRLWPEAADTQRPGQLAERPWPESPPLEFAVHGQPESSLSRIAETLDAVFTLGQRFRDLQTRFRTGQEGEASHSTVTKPEPEMVAANLKKETAIAVLKAQLDAVREQHKSEATVRDRVQLQVENGILDPPALPAAELVVVTTAADIRILELLIEHYGNLSAENVPTVKEERELAIAVLNVRIEAEHKNLEFRADECRRKELLFKIGDSDTHQILKAEQAEATVAARVRQLESLRQYYENFPANKGEANLGRPAISSDVTPVELMKEVSADSEAYSQSAPVAPPALAETFSDNNDGKVHVYLYVPGSRSAELDKLVSPLRSLVGDRALIIVNSVNGDRLTATIHPPREHDAEFVQEIAKFLKAQAEFPFEDVKLNLNRDSSDGGVDESTPLPPKSYEEVSKDNNARQRPNARMVVEAYIAAALAGEVEAASALAKDAPADAKQIAEIPEFLNVQRLKIRTVHVNDPANPTEALATSEAVRLDDEHKQPNGDRDGALVLTLKLINGVWLVTDIDFATPADADEELKRFLDANPNAIWLPPGNGANATAAADESSDWGFVGESSPATDVERDNVALTEPGSYVTVPLKVEWHPEAAMKRHLGQRHLTLLADGNMQDERNTNAVSRTLRSLVHDCRLESFELATRDEADYWNARIFVPLKAEYSIGSLWYRDPIRTLRIGDRHTPVPAPSLTQDDPQAKLDEELENGFQLRLDDSTEGAPALSFERESGGSGSPENNNDEADAFSKLAAMPDWVIAWDSQLPSDQVSNGRRLALLRGFADGRILAVHGADAELVQTQVAPAEIKALLKKFAALGTKRSPEVSGSIVPKEPAGTNASVNDDPLPRVIPGLIGNGLTVIHEGSHYDLMSFQPTAPNVYHSPALRRHKVAELSDEIRQQLMQLVYRARLGGFDECLAFANAQLRARYPDTPVELKASDIHQLYSPTEDVIEVIFRFGVYGQPISFPGGVLKTRRGSEGNWSVVSGMYFPDESTTVRWTGSQEQATSSDSSGPEESAQFDARVTDSHGFLTAKQAASLEQAVVAFNRIARQSEIGRNQQDLTADEVIASLRNWIERNDDNAATRKELQEVIDTKMLKPEHQLSFTSRHISEGHVFDVWKIQFGCRDSGSWLSIRDVRLASRPKTLQEHALWEQTMAEMEESFSHFKRGTSNYRSLEEQARFGQLMEQVYQSSVDISAPQSADVEARLQKLRPYRSTSRAQIEDRTHKILQQPTVKSIKKLSLAEVPEQFARFHDVKIVIDPLWLEEETPDLNQPVSADLGDLTLSAALDFILKPFGMSYIVREDEIRITSIERAASYQYERFYVLPTLLKGQEKQVIEALTTKVTPDKWWLAGGEYVAAATDGCLTISANRNAHEAAAALLEELQTATLQQSLPAPAKGIEQGNSNK